MGTPQRVVRRKQQQQQQQQLGGGVGVRVPPLSLFSSLFFSRSLPSRRTPLSERLEQANSKDPPKIPGGGLLRPGGDGTEISGIDIPAVWSMHHNNND